MKVGKLGTWNSCVQLHLFYYKRIAMFQVLRLSNDAVSTATRPDRFLSAVEPKAKVDAVSLECYNRFEEPKKALWELAGSLLMKL